MTPHFATRFVQGALTNAFLSLCVAASVGHADQPQFVNAKLESRVVAQSLETSVNQIAAETEQPLWLGYAVEAVAGNHSVCCGYDHGYSHDGDCETCNLEQQHGNSLSLRNKGKTVKLEGQRELIVLFRVENKTVMRIRLASEECTLDAGGLRMVWLNGVKPEESVALLTKYVAVKNFAERRGQGLSEEALAAIALHADASADRAFAFFVTPEQPPALREKAVFWLGAARGKTGLALLEKLAKSDPSTHVREQVTFALSVSSEPGALDEMIRMAHEDPDPHVRGQALFWLGQSEDPRALAFFEKVLSQ